MGANPSWQEGGAPIENQRTLRIHLVLEVKIPEEATLFQALTLAFWRFQGLAVTTLFTAVLQAIEARTRGGLGTRGPGPAGGTCPSARCGSPWPSPGRNASDVTTFHHVNGIHAQVRSGPGHPSR